jgi:CheY-like chemotaxis protein/EAL domain-containing protein (putative c-di-GMP-specific phosphodiesterase class I)
VKPVSTPLPREIISALSNYQSLRKGAWNQGQAVAVHSGLLDAALSAERSSRDSLSRSLTDLALYLGFLVDGEILAPNPVQLQKLASLEEAVLGLLREERAAALAASEDSRKRLLILAPDSKLWQSLTQRLEAGPHRVERYTSVAQMLGQLQPIGLAAVLIDQEYLSDLGTVTDRLETSRGAEALGATIIYVNRSRDLAARVLALSSGSDASLEGEDLDYLVARTYELLDVRDRHENLRILLVEDDRSQAMYCEAILRKQGIEVRVCAESGGVLDEIREFSPDLVLMDLHMPGMDGMQLTTLIREQPEMALLPIVFLTGEQDEGSRFDALRAGGDDFLTKPVRPRNLLNAVVTRARRARALRQQFSGKPAQLPSRLLHAGEFVLRLRQLGNENPCNDALLMCMADSGQLRAKDAHLAVERENQYTIALKIQAELGDNEAIAPWHGGGFVLLIEKSRDTELLARAELIRGEIAALSRQRGCGEVSMAVLPLPAESLPTAETLIELAERTIAVAHHSGGARVRRALAESQSDMPADLSLAIQKALVVEASSANVNVLFQPIVPLHGAARPQFHLHLGLRIDDTGERVITRLQWLSLARQTGHALGLDRFAVAQAIKYGVEARKRFPGLRIFVAITAESLVNAEFRQYLVESLVESGLNDSGLVLSIDQSEAMLMHQHLRLARQELRAAHVLLCFGRVGMDANANDVIEELRPDVIAVDAMTLRSASQAPSILPYARDRGAEIVAHFIPDAHTLARLFALGVDYGMGSFIGAPGPQLNYDFGEQQVA